MAFWLQQAKGKGGSHRRSERRVQQRLWQSQVIPRSEFSAWVMGTPRRFTALEDLGAQWEDRAMVSTPTSLETLTKTPSNLGR